VIEPLRFFLFGFTVFLY